MLLALQRLLLQLLPVLRQQALDMLKDLPGRKLNPVIYAVQPSKHCTTKGRRVHQAMLRVPYEVSGFDPDAPSGVGVSTKGGKGGVFVRE